MKLFLLSSFLLVSVSAGAADPTPRSYARRFLGCMKKKDKVCLAGFIPHEVAFNDPARLDCPIGEKASGKAQPAELIDCVINPPAATGAVRLRDALIGCFSPGSKWDAAKKTFRAKNDVVCTVAGPGKKVVSLESIEFPTAP